MRLLGVGAGTLLGKLTRGAPSTIEEEGVGLLGVQYIVLWFSLLLKVKAQISTLLLTQSCSTRNP